MPEQPQPKARPHPWQHGVPETPAAHRSARSNSREKYVELQVASNFTFLTGASHPDELVQQAAELGHEAAAITDLNSLAGIVRGHLAAKDAGIQFITGCRLQFTMPHRLAGSDLEPWCVAQWHGHSARADLVRAECPHHRLEVLVYPQTRKGYGDLCRLLTLGKRRASKGECHLALHDLFDYADDLVAIALPPTVLDQDFIEALAGLKRRFEGDRLSLAASCLYGQDDRQRLRQLEALALHAGVPLVATNDVHYHVRQRRALQDVLTCIKHGCTIEQAGLRLFANAERHLKAPAEMARLFADYPGALARTVEIAARTASFSLDELRYQYPDEVVPAGLTPMQHLINLTWAGAVERYPQGLPDKTRTQIEHEFRLIAELNYAPYFLTVHDIVVFARAQGILCQGRGAAANSAVCYCLGVTAVDPERIDVLFERFVSKERNEPPDIDVDFEHERREEVIQYIYRKYGRERAGLTAEVITYRGRLAVREVGKALGLSLDCVDRLAKNLEWWMDDMADPQRLREHGLNAHDPTIRNLVALAGELQGFPRHLSQHVGGFVITRDPLCEMVPVENAAMPERTVIEWDKDDIDAMGMLKVDVLGLGMLTCIRKALELVNRSDEATERRSDEGEGGSDEEEMVNSGTRSEAFFLENTYGTHQNISGTDRLAEEHGIGSDGVFGDGTNAFIGAVRFDQSNASCGGFGSFKHCGGTRASEQAGLPQASANRARFTGGIVNATRTGHKHGNDAASSAYIGNAERSRSSVAGSDSQSGTEKGLIELSDEATERRSDEGGDGSDEGENCAIHVRIRNGPGDKDSIGAFNARVNLVLASLYDPNPAQRIETETPSSLRRSVASSLSRSPPPSSLVHPFPLQLHTIPPEDPAVYDMICAADTVGVFQIESRAQMSMLPRLQPRCFYDLVIEVAIVRPGPIQGDMVHPYLRRRNGEEKETYPDERIERVLKKTLGVPLFQEQAMSLAIVAAGFTPGQADQLRRAIAAWKTRGNQIETYGRQMMEGMIANGYDETFARRCFEQVKGFSGYGFPESHAASFALLVYASSWLKKHYPAAFAAALLNSQPMGFYAPAQIVRDAQEHGVEVRPVDVNCSAWDCTLERQSDEATERRSDGGKERDETPAGTLRVPGPALRLGMRLVRHLSEAQAELIVAARQRGGRFASIASLRRVSGARVATLRHLASADAFGSLGLDRQAALWQVRALSDESLPMFDEIAESNDQELSPKPVTLPEVPPYRKVAHDYATMGLSLRAHPVSFLRPRLAALGATPAEQLKDEARWRHGRRITVAGLVLVRQRPSTANGIIFMTIEDETGIANLIVRPDIYRRDRKAVRHGLVILVKGRVERQGAVVHVLAQKVESMPLDDGTLRSISRDFH